MTRRLLGLAAGLLIATLGRAQQTLPDGTGGPISSANPSIPTVSPLAPPARSGIYRDLDLLRRNGFSEAQQAAVSVRVLDPAGLIPGNLKEPDFTLIVNGTPRAIRVHAPGTSETAIPPLVLLVLPPNQPIVHSIAIKNAEKYFAKQPAELLPWKVGIFDSDGKMTPFTNGRSQLLANLDVIDHTKEPFQYASSAGLPAGAQWEGGWILKAEDAIGSMQRFDGPKVVLAINPLSENLFGLNDQMFAHNGPESLAAIAKTIGAHIYIANVGGPDVYIPGGGAADDHPAQINTLSGPILGTSPSYHMQVDPQMTAALNFYAYRTSMMMQTAEDTLGGYANSFSDLAGKIHSDLDGNYTLDFDMTAADTDKGVPSIEVRMTRHDLRVAILDLTPLISESESNRQVLSRQLMEDVKRATQHPVSSPDYSIAQRVDYFPFAQGLEPVLPMSGRVMWTGHGKAPQQIYIVESVEDLNLSNSILERAIQTRWDGQSFSWERDGQLVPGSYVWRVAVHDGHGKVLASAERKIPIAFPRQAAMAVSSLVLGKSCREGELSSGLQKRPAKGDSDQGHTHFMIDPLHAADCRVRPEATDNFATTDTMHAFVRIYPDAKLERHRPESWTAKFVLRSTTSGLVEMEREIPFSTDSGSGYLALLQAPLSAPAISTGPHTLDVQLHGPGMHSNLNASRTISIVSAP